MNKGVKIIGDVKGEKVSLTQKVENYILPDGYKQRAIFKLEDVSYEYQINKSSTKTKPSKELIRIRSTFKESHCLFISGSDSDMVDEALSELLDGTEIIDYKCRFISFDQEGIEEKILKFQSFFKRNFLSNKERIILIYNLSFESENAEHVRRFYDSLYIDPHDKKVHEQEFRKSKVFHIMINGEGEDPTLRRGRGNRKFCIPFWKVKSEEEGKENRTIDKLPEFIDSKENIYSIKRVVCFVVAFFPNLSYSLFKRITEELLVQIEGKIKVELKEGSEREGKDKKKKKKKKKEFESISALDFWRAHADEVFESCHLCIEEGDAGSKVVAFKEKEQKHYLYELFWKKYPNFLHQQFLKLDNFNGKGLQFVDWIPAHTRRDMLKISVKMALSDTWYFDHDWLDSLVKKFVKKLLPLIQEIRRESIKGETDQYKRLGRLLKELEKREEETHFFYDQLGELLWEMLWEEPLREIVGRFLDLLIEKFPIDVLLKLIGKLGASQHFNVSKWALKLWKQTLKIEDEEEKAKATIIISQFLHYTWVDEPDKIWEAIDTWFPLGIEKKEKLEDHELLPLLFLLEYCIVHAVGLPTKSYGKWPSSYEVFQELNEEDVDFDRIDRLLFLFSKVISKRDLPAPSIIVAAYFLFYLEEENPFHLPIPYAKVNSFTVYADIIELWYIILTGWKKKGNKVPKEILHQFIRMIKNQLSKKRQRQLLEHWDLKVRKTASYFGKLGGVVKESSRNHMVWSNRERKIEELMKLYQKL